MISEAVLMKNGDKLFEPAAFLFFKQFSSLKTLLAVVVVVLYYFVSNGSKRNTYFYNISEKGTRSISDWDTASRPQRSSSRAATPHYRR